MRVRSAKARRYARPAASTSPATRIAQRRRQPLSRRYTERDIAEGRARSRCGERPAPRLLHRGRRVLPPIALFDQGARRPRQRPRPRRIAEEDPRRCGEAGRVLRDEEMLARPDVDSLARTTRGGEPRPPGQRQQPTDMSVEAL